MAAHKWVYQFSEGSAKMRDLLGGKGAGAAEMTRAGMPVPPGFTITTEACREYYARGRKLPAGLWDQVLGNLKTLERKAGKRFGDPKDPLLVSVRSGAKFSMPGMMDTVLNLGLNEETAKGLAALTKNERFALDARRRFIQMFGKTVKGIDGDKFEHALQQVKKEARVKTDPELTPPYLRKLVARYLDIYKDATKHNFPDDPVVQLTPMVVQAAEHPGRRGRQVGLDEAGLRSTGPARVEIEAGRGPPQLAERAAAVAEAGNRAPPDTGQGRGQGQRLGLAGAGHRFVNRPGRLCRAAPRAGGGAPAGSRPGRRSTVGAAHPRAGASAPGRPRPAAWMHAPRLSRARPGSGHRWPGRPGPPAPSRPE